MNMDGTIAKEIELLLKGSGLSEGVLSIINDWLAAGFSSKGKYAWAQLTLITCDSTGGALEESLPGAVAMELYALAADILDDIQDQDNNSLPWRKVPPAQAINLGTCILLLSYEALEALADPRHGEAAGRVLNRMGLQACDGQFHEFLHDNKDQITFAEYFEIINKKSAGLMAGACKIGAILGGAEPDLASQLEEFGRCLGIMSQIKNDLDDFLNLETKSDFIKGRKTLPFVYLLNVLKEREAETLKYLSTLARKGSAEFGSREQEQLRELLVNEGTVQYCSVIHEVYKQRGLDIIQGMPIPKKQKEKLIQLVG